MSMQRRFTLSSKTIDLIVGNLKREPIQDMSKNFDFLNENDHHTLISQEQKQANFAIKRIPFIKSFIQTYFKESEQEPLLQKGTIIYKQGDLVNRNIYVLLNGTVLEAKQIQGIFSEIIKDMAHKSKQFICSIQSQSKGSYDMFIEESIIQKFLTEQGPVFSQAEVGQALEEDFLFNTGPRKTSLITVSNSEFLIFDKTSFWKIQQDKAKEKTRIRNLIQESIQLDFNSYCQSTISGIISSFKEEIKYSQNDFLIREGDVSQRIFIIQGSHQVFMKYLIKKNFKRSIATDMSGELLIDTIPSGCFLVGEEIVFESWKKYKYSVKLTGKKPCVLSCHAKDVETLFGQAMRKMKEIYLKKMISYKRKYEEGIQEIVKSAQSQNSNVHQNQDIQHKKGIYKKIIKSPSNSIEDIKKTILQNKQIQNKLEMCIVSQNCCFQMLSPTFYSIENSDFIQGDQKKQTQEQQQQQQNSKSYDVSPQFLTPQKFQRSNFLISGDKSIQINESISMQLSTPRSKKTENQTNTSFSSLKNEVILQASPIQNYKFKDLSELIGFKENQSPPANEQISQNYNPISFLSLLKDYSFSRTNSAQRQTFPSTPPQSIKKQTNRSESYEMKQNDQYNPLTNHKGKIISFQLKHRNQRYNKFNSTMTTTNSIKNYQLSPKKKVA